MNHPPLRTFRVLLPSLLLALLAGPAAPATADEGMWLFNEFPAERVREAHGWAPDPAWLDRVREAAVRFNNGGSGSFVSPDGLVITNHHVGIDCIQKLSSAENDYVTDGFTAATRADELPCPDLELNVLDSIERVTGRVRGAVPEGAADQAAAEARRAETARIEAECQEATGLRCNVISLYQGGEYDLYRYRRHTDVRLAWAPELALANFGGDQDNFEYPRYVLDAALFRVWEDGEPLTAAAHLPVDPSGPQQGELTFLVGNPGSTGRLATLAELHFLRDVAYPFAQAGLQHQRDVLLAYSERGEEEARIARDDLLGVENSLKAISGYLSGLLDEELMATKARQEAELRRRVAADEALAARVGDPWADMARALDTYRGVYARSQALGGASSGRLPGLAKSIVRLTAELAKPNTERRPSFRDTALPSYYQRLYSDAPVYPGYDELRLTQGLQRLAYQFGPTHPMIEEVLGDRTPEQVAREAIAGTKLADVAVRRRLVEGGAAAVAASDDPMIVLMREIEPYDRVLDDLVEDEVDAVEADAGERIAEAYFAVHGTDTYPDATFTLRVSYGTVKSYGDLPWHTTFQGLFDRAAKFGNQPPFRVPDELAAAKERVDLATPLDFVTTHDVIGGNSGSPVVDREGRFVGIVFDGNLEMLPNRFVYSMERARGISVDVRAILEVLRNVYPAGHLADELVGSAGR
ncbi:MAG TPA: S46 family peptidase [Thermoanaerobaculia bacterium]|nr:S46 family peptidase [Thermoanaerobaculia bacterium]